MANPQELLNSSGFGTWLRTNVGSWLSDPSDTEKTPIDDISSSSNTEDKNDWRVRLSIPPAWGKGAGTIEGREYESLEPLFKTSGFIFPYTPTIMMQHTATYDTIKPTHSNYPFLTYQNSSVEAFTIAGDFLIENEMEGRYWTAALHYLRSVTKMGYGDDDFNCAPPPVVKLNGYGPHIFKDVPVVVQSFNIELPNDVDYIMVRQEKGDTEVKTWVPTRSNIAVNVHTAYSRRKVSTFSLEKFANGSYLNTDKGFI